MTRRRYREVDVFGASPLAGNPVAVVLDADGLDGETMQAFARWTNLSETTFVSDASADDASDYRVRIFTPGGELPFAGHPTLGSAAAWLDAGGVPASEGRVVQRCGIGEIELSRSDGMLAFAAPPLARSGRPEPDVLAQATRALGLEPDQVVDAEWVDNGPGWLAVLVADRDTVLGVTPDADAMGDLRLGVAGFAPEGSGAAIEVRAFVPTLGVGEDPVTGSLNAGLALWLQRTGRLPDSYVAAQGTALGRAGRVHVVLDGGTTWIGGATHVVVRGECEL